MYLCGEVFKLRNLEIDHRTPQSRYYEINGTEQGLHDRDNLQLLCGTCNREKGTKTMEEFEELRATKKTNVIKVGNEFEEDLEE